MAEASPGGRARPLSPYVTIWRWHITMATSILHRATGVALYGGALILAGWAFTLAAGGGAYAAYMGLMGSFIGRLILFGITLSAFYHLANGVRHLVWDTGHALDVKSADRSAVAVIAFAVAASAVVWAIGLTGAAR